MNRIEFIYDFVVALISSAIFFLSHVAFVFADIEIIKANMNFANTIMFLFLAGIIISLIVFATIGPVSDLISYFIEKITSKEIDIIMTGFDCSFCFLYFLVPYIIYFLLLRSWK